MKSKMGKIGHVCNPSAWALSRRVSGLRSFSATPQVWNHFGTDSMSKQ